MSKDALDDRHAGGRGGRVRAIYDLLRAAVAGSEHDYTSMRTGRAVVLLAIPMMLEMTMESIFVVVDIFFIARLGPEAVAAVGLTEAVLTILYALAIGLSMGVTAMVARRVGEHDPDAASVVAGQSLWLGLLVSLAVGVVGVVYAQDILQLMGGEATVVATGRSYMAILLGGSVTIVYIFLLNAVFRGAGDAALAMRVLWLANGINIVLDPLLIFGIGPFPELGVAGAAIATNIGRGVGVVYQIYCLTRQRGSLQLRWGHLVLRPRVIGRLIIVSLGGILQFVVATSSWIVLMRLVAPFGSAAIAGYTIGVRVLALTFLPAWGLGNAAATLVGQNLGAGAPDRAERSVWCAAKYNAIFLGVVAVFMIATPRMIVGWFTSDPETLEIGAQCLRIIAYGYVFYAVGMVVAQAFNGAGDTYTPTWINFICYWVLQLPVAFTLTQAFDAGPRGVFWAVTAGESAVAVLAVAIFLRGRWKLRVV